MSLSGNSPGAASSVMPGIFPPPDAIVNDSAITDRDDVGRRTSCRPALQTSSAQPRTQVRPGYARRDDPATAYHEVSPNSAPLLASVLDKKEVANLLSVPETWVATHWTEIPGTFRLGRNLRFRRAVIEEWLGGSSRLFEPEKAAEILLVNRSWVYAHADQIPGVMRLGRYIRFKPSLLLAFLNEGACQ